MFSVLRLLPVLAAALVCSSVSAGSRQHESFDFDWRFAIGEYAGAEQAGFDDAGWRGVDLPHDWSIEGRINAANPTGAAGGFFSAGLGWYRKTFVAPESWAGRLVSIGFEGVYQDSSVWLNGQLLGQRPYGYSGFSYDVTPYLRIGAKNTVAVRVDNTHHVNSRWYSGSGIYRHVWLTITEPLHIAESGMFISTPSVSAEEADATVQAEIRSGGAPSGTCILQVHVLSPDSREVAAGFSKTLSFSKGSAVATVAVKIARPQLWSPERPALYRAIVELSEDGHATDSVTQTFGIRTLRVSAERGFELNGQSIKRAGGCLHHDNGCLGAAAFDRAEERKVELLKAAGFNAVRTAHNPPSPAFLNACDRLGLMVADEIFDCWRSGKNDADYSKVFDQWWRADVDSWVLRDRNHPSVVLWDLGNELPDAGTTGGIDTGTFLARRVRELDPSRPLTAAVFWWSGMPWKWPDADPLFAQLDVSGTNYQLDRLEEDHQRGPTRVFLSTESYLRDTFRCWQAAQEHSYFIGDFVWSAMDYLGESGIGRNFAPGREVIDHNNPRQYPYHGAYCGDIDLTGFPRPISHYRNILWNHAERIYTAVLEPTTDGRPFGAAAWGIAPAWASWTWPGFEGRPLTVEVYSNCEVVRLYLNNVPVGEAPTTRQKQFKATFVVPYKAGMLRAVGLDGGQPVAENILSTAGPPAALRLIVDRSVLRADGQDLGFVTIESIDGRGNFQPNGDQTVNFALSGPGVIAGVGSADFANEEPYQGHQRRLFHGRAQLVIRTVRAPGEMRLSASAPTLNPAQMVIESQP
jgi:beta-galactosidase